MLNLTLLGHTNGKNKNCTGMDTKNNLNKSYKRRKVLDSHENIFMLNENYSTIH